MSARNFKKGDRVHVEYTGVVTQVMDDSVTYRPCWDLRITPEGHATVDTYVRHEHVSRIEPDYEDNACYVDAHGVIFLRRRYSSSHPWRGVVAGIAYEDHVPARPLRKLVPES